MSAVAHLWHKVRHRWENGIPAVLGWRQFLGIRNSLKSELNQMPVLGPGKKRSPIDCVAIIRTCRSDREMAHDGIVVTSVRAVYAFKGKNNDELNFKKGDVITVTQKPDGGWWEGTLSGVTGWFPSNYVRECRAESIGSARKATKVSKVSSNNLPSRQDTAQIYRNVVLKDIIDSERAHLNDLLALRDAYLLPLQVSELLNVEEFRTLVGNLDDVVEIHRKLLITLEDCSDISSNYQRIGATFMNLAPILKAVHLGYCSNHPFAVTVLERHRDNLNLFMESYGAPPPGLHQLTTGLSRPFRRLEKYRGLLLEVERHTDESHLDRGDTQRAVHIYRDISEACSEMRRRKQTELEVLQGNILGWEGESVKSLGEIILMTHVTVVSELKEKKERHLVLFSSTLVFLSVGKMSAFVYEGKLPLTGIEVSRLDDTDPYRNAFEIAGKMINTIVVVCHGAEELNEWVDALHQQISASWASIASPGSSTPKPLVIGARSVSTSPVHSDALTAIAKLQSPKTPFKRANSVWSMSCLRPSPQLRPCSPYNPSSGATSSRDEAARRASFNRSFMKKDCHSPHEDVLDVIDSYCTSANKSRHTVNSEFLANQQVPIADEKIIDEVTTGDGTIVEEKSLVDTVYALKDQVKELQRDMKLVLEALEVERMKRKRLEDIVRRFHGQEEDVHWDDE